MCLFQLWMVQKESRQWRRLCTWRQKSPFLAGQQFSSLTKMSGGKNSSTWWWVLSHFASHHFLAQNQREFLRWTEWYDAVIWRLSTEKYHAGSAWVGQSDIWITMQLLQVRKLVDMWTKTSTHPDRNESATAVIFFVCVQWQGSKWPSAAPT